MCLLGSLLQVCIDAYILDVSKTQCNSSLLLHSTLERLQRQFLLIDAWTSDPRAVNFAGSRLNLRNLPIRRVSSSSLRLSMNSASVTRLTLLAGVVVSAVSPVSAWPTPIRSFLHLRTASLEADSLLRRDDPPGPIVEPSQEVSVNSRYRC